MCSGLEKGRKSLLDNKDAIIVGGAVLATVFGARVGVMSFKNHIDLQQAEQAELQQLLELCLFGVDPGVRTYFTTAKGFHRMRRWVAALLPEELVDRLLQSGAITILERDMDGDLVEFVRVEGPADRLQRQRQQYRADRKQQKRRKRRQQCGYNDRRRWQEWQLNANPALATWQSNIPSARVLTVQEHDLRLRWLFTDPGAAPPSPGPGGGGGGGGGAYGGGLPLPPPLPQGPRLGVVDILVHYFNPQQCKKRLEVYIRKQRAPDTADFTLSLAARLLSIAACLALANERRGQDRSEGALTAPRPTERPHGTAFV
ncbi:hypothetical protein CHLRE_06g270726v5 [Chlamydomonas reinhardtii]|uniref:Uncharacterized protein n=1 Tax=Chlamydomonas reinhardtii TaxID=3055 RepID=A0A2K3DNB7_CHLRE|nr:uncharacterized protein CHLRE_06g270726v5 [Chlamydomonas reinhardtii]PNW82027.1 hypothetical protein CHLRE_06g270726v5 [Chlamydomonas reinhardtii]